MLKTRKTKLVKIICIESYTYNDVIYNYLQEINKNNKGFW